MLSISACFPINRYTTWLIFVLCLFFSGIHLVMRTTGSICIYFWHPSTPKNVTKTVMYVIQKQVDHSTFLSHVCGTLLLSLLIFLSCMKTPSLILRKMERCFTHLSLSKPESTRNKVLAPSQSSSPKQY